MTSLPLVVLPCDKPLSLKNNGELELFFIGVGSAFATKNHQTNFFIIKGDRHIMVDFGMTGPVALQETTGLNPLDIDTTLITHSHADHAGGVEALALMNRYVGLRLGKPKLRMIITEEYQRILWEHTLSGGMSWNEEVGESRRLLGFEDYFDVIRPKWMPNQSREVFELRVGNIHLEMFRTKHIPDTSDGWQNSFVSFGLLIDGHVFASVDTRFDPELLEMYANRANIMFHDVQFFPGGVHSSMPELKTLPPEIKAKMFLVHYGDNWENQDISDFAGWTEQGKRYIFR